MQIFQVDNSSCSFFNPTIGQEKTIRYHSFITAIFLRIFFHIGLCSGIVEMQDESKKKWYLNRGSLKEWIQYYDSSARDLKKCSAQELLDRVQVIIVKKTAPIAPEHAIAIELIGLMQFERESKSSKQIERNDCCSHVNGNCCSHVNGKGMKQDLDMLMETL